MYLSISHSQHAWGLQKERASSVTQLWRQFNQRSILPSQPALGTVYFYCVKDDEYVPPRSVHLWFCLLVSLGSLDLSELFLSHLSNCYLDDQPYLLESLKATEILLI